MSTTVPFVPLVRRKGARLAQVAANLLNNAAKYSADGGQIEVRLTEEQGMGVVSVRDQGVGDARDDLVNGAFFRFVRHKVEVGRITEIMAD